MMRNTISNLYDMLKAYNAPAIACVLFYAFVCLFGNIITGIYVYKGPLKDEDIGSVAKTIVATLGTSKNASLGVDNNRDMVEDLIKTLEEETITLVDPFIVYTNITVCNFQYAFECSIV